MLQEQPVAFSLRRNSFRRRANVDDRGWTPLHIKARKGDLKSVKQLLDQGVDVNALEWGPKSKGVTPLHLAAEGGHVEVMGLLLKRSVCTVEALTEIKASLGWSHGSLKILVEMEISHPGLMSLVLHKEAIGLSLNYKFKRFRLLDVFPLQ